MLNFGAECEFGDPNLLDYQSHKFNDANGELEKNGWLKLKLFNSSEFGSASKVGE